MIQEGMAYAAICDLCGRVEDEDMCSEFHYMSHEDYPRITMWNLCTKCANKLHKQFREQRPAPAVHVPGSYALPGFDETMKALEKLKLTKVNLPTVFDEVGQEHNDTGTLTSTYSDNPTVIYMDKEQGHGK